MKKIIIAIISGAILFSLCACTEQHVHCYGEWKITVQPTCSTEGTKERFCECGDKQVKAAEKKNHMPGKWTVDKATGKRTEVCAVCGEVMCSETLTYDETLKLEYEVNDDGLSCTVTGYESISSADLVIPETLDGYTVTAIGDAAFFDCSLIETVVLPKTVTAIGISAFNQCTSLTDIALNEGLLTVGSYAFYNCRSLEAITLPKTVAKIAKLTFAGCVSLESVSFSDGLTSVGNNAFYNCMSLEEITLPESVTAISTNAFKQCSGLKKITVLGILNSIGAKAFAYCGNLEEISLAEGNEKYYLKGNCIIEDATKKLVAGLKNAQIPSNVKIIGESAFEGITGIRSLTIPSSVETIEHDAFAKCYDLEEINIPKSVNTIDGYVFYKDTSLKTITYDGTVGMWDKIRKNSVWDLGTEEYVLKCLDGEISKKN